MTIGRWDQGNIPDEEVEDHDEMLRDIHNIFSDALDDCMAPRNIDKAMVLAKLMVRVLSDARPPGACDEFVEAEANWLVRHALRLKEWSENNDG